MTAGTSGKKFDSISGTVRVSMVSALIHHKERITHTRRTIIFHRNNTILLSVPVTGPMTIRALLSARVLGVTGLITGMAIQTILATIMPKIPIIWAVAGRALTRKMISRGAVAARAISLPIVIKGSATPAISGMAGRALAREVTFGGIMAA